MKRVAFLIPTIDRLGGAELQVISLACGLVQRGWEASVVALSGSGGAAAEQLRSINVAYASLDMRKGLADPRGWFRLHSWINEHQPEIIHAHLPHAALLARWSRMVSPVRVLVDTIHSPATGGIARRLGYRISRGLPDVVTAVSLSAAEPWLKSRAANESELIIIPNGIDLDRFRPDDGGRVVARQELSMDDNFLWLAVGRLDPVKDHATLLRAFSMLPENARLIVAGDGPLQSELSLLTNQLGLRERVRFLGFEPNMLRWFRAADGFVLCSRWEGLPIALLEASACGLPSVITDIAGAREVLPMSPLASPVGDAVALASSMRDLMNLSPAERRERGRCAREFVSSRFSMVAVLDRWEELYGELLKSNPQPRRSGRSSLSPGRTFQLQ